MYKSPLKSREKRRPGQRRLWIVLPAVLGLALLVSPAARAIGTTAGTVISNQAYADYEDANGNALTRVYSNTVTTTVSQVAAVDVTPPTTTVTGQPDTQTVIGVSILNEGNGSDTFDLAVSGLEPGWTATMYWDENGDDVWDPINETTVVTDTGAVPADGAFEIVVVVDIPGTAVNGDSSSVVVTATSQFDTNVSDTGSYTVNVLGAVINASKAVYDSTGYQPGDTVTFSITGSNSGSATAEDVVISDVIPDNTTYVAGSTRLGPVGGSYAASAVQTDANDPGTDDTYFNSGTDTLTIDWGDAAPAEDGIIYFQVIIDSGVPSGTRIENEADIDYSVAGVPQATKQSSRAFFDVTDLPDVDLAATLTSQSGDPGDQIVYPFTVTNDGNATDTIDITYTSSAGLTWAFWVDNDGNGIPGTGGDVLLTDTDGDGIIDTDDMTQDSTKNLLAVATISAGTSDGTTDSLAVTGTSSIDTDISDQQSFTTTVTAPVLAVAKSVAPTGNQPPGTELVYTIEISNSGTGTATSVVLTDAVPADTTYKTGSLETGSSLATLVTRTEASDGDGGRYDDTNKRVLAGSGGTISLGSGGKLFMQFTVTID